MILKSHWSSRSGQSLISMGENTSLMTVSNVWFQIKMWLPFSAESVLLAQCSISMTQDPSSLISLNPQDPTLSYLFSLPGLFLTVDKKFTYLIWIRAAAAGVAAILKPRSQFCQIFDTPLNFFVKIYSRSYYLVLFTFPFTDDSSLHWNRIQSQCIVLSHRPHTRWLDIFFKRQCVGVSWRGENHNLYLASFHFVICCLELLLRKLKRRAACLIYPTPPPCRKKLRAEHEHCSYFISDISTADFCHS